MSGGLQPRARRDSVTAIRPPIDQYSSIIMETHRAQRTDVTVIVHGESDGLVRVLHGLCNVAVRKALQDSTASTPSPVQALESAIS